MHKDDVDNFLKLATALKIFLGRTIQLRDLDRATELLLSYLQGYCEVRHSFTYIHLKSTQFTPAQMHEDHIKPNHHWCTHLFDQILDYGPVYGFWSFTYERLNKSLGSVLSIICYVRISTLL